jgi:hypothetical protein
MLMLGRTSTANFRVFSNKGQKIKLKLILNSEITSQRKYEINIDAFHSIEMF